ncbi:ECF-type sigma factor [Pontiellaceae bacterium B12227]|nr:ECF-type sigma factor [Pontiellaceae bacterium B12227]
MKDLPKSVAPGNAAKDVTRILEVEHPEGPDTTTLLLPLVYDELRHLAAYRLSQERPGQTLQATALVNEAYLRLVKNPNMHWENKRHFFNAAAEAMRRILFDNARKKNCQKRGGDWRRTEIEMGNIEGACLSDEAQQVHEVLDQFAEIDPESAELVKLRFFAGLTQQQAADILGISKRTADNRWAFARAWLYRAIQEDEQ